MRAQLSLFMDLEIMKTVSIRLDPEFIQILDELVRQKKYMNRSEAMRIALRDYIKKYLIKDQPVFFFELNEKKEKEIQKIQHKYLN